jgi:hypothetical protein
VFLLPERVTHIHKVKVVDEFFALLDSPFKPERCIGERGRAHAEQKPESAIPAQNIRISGAADNVIADYVDAVESFPWFALFSGYALYFHS